MGWSQTLVLVAAREHFLLVGWKEALVGCQETSHLVALAGQADPIDRQPGVEPRIDLNHYHRKWEQERRTGYPVGSKMMRAAAAVPTGLVMRVHPRIAVHLHCQQLDFPTWEIVVEPGPARPNRRVAAEPGFARPTRKLVEQQGVECPNPWAVAAEPGSVPSLELVVEEQDFARPTRGLAVESELVHPNRQPVGRDFAHPSHLVAAGPPTGWVVALVDPRD
jgi:hypothetical protein